MKCPKCQIENPETALFCAGCGAKLDAAKDLSLFQTETLQTPIKELTSGSTFAGRYQVIEEIGKGGMGEVYKVLDTRIKEKVALKLIRPEVASDRQTIERFSNELRLARKIRHKNVCGMYDLGEAEGSLFITMEYVHGEDLKSMIRMSGSLSLGMLLSVGQQICDGLAEAHSIGVVHRDLKPQNIMIDKNGNAKIMDFGIARSVREKGITGPSVLIGTPQYMSPEQAEGREVDHRSDIYSLGVILYEMATSRVPFEGETALAIAMKHKTEIPKNPKQLNPSLPDDLSGVILKCLEKEKARRYQSAADLRSELEKIEKGIPTAERFVPERKTITSREIMVTLKLKKLLVPLSAAIAVLVIALFAWRNILPKKGSAALSRIRSMAVMPFEDLSPQKDQGYICEGLADELITRLIGVEGLKIPARASAFLLRGKGPQEIGQKLGVDAVLDGTLLRADEKIRVNIQITDAGNGYGLWSGKFEGNEEGLFNLRDEIALKILESLEVKLLGEARSRIVKNYTANPEAYNLYLRGRYFWNKRAPDDVNRAIDFFNQAIALDPDFALAYSGLADSYLVLLQFLGYRMSELLPKAKEAALKALALDNTVAEAYVSLANVKEWEWDLPAAEADFKRSIALNPNYSTGHFWYACLLAMMGRMTESQAEMRRALELDPLSLIFNVVQALNYLELREIDQAIEQARRAVELDPNFVLSRWTLGVCFRAKGMLKEAVAELERREPYGSSPSGLGDLGMAYALSGEREKAIEVLSLLEEYLQGGYAVNAEIAAVHLGLGNREKALGYLEKAAEDEDEIAYLREASTFRYDPQWDSLRSDPRFKRLLEKLHLK